MKQMTKEELIEYFIEQLGDNEILGKVMSIEQIRKKLTELIKNVTYNKDNKGKTSGYWIAESGVINIDLKNIPEQEQKGFIVHELLHALSTSTQKVILGLQISEKCGLKLNRDISNGIPRLDEYNRAINEGMTDALAEMIIGKHINSVYRRQKDIFRIVSIIVGKETMLKKFFSEEALDSKTGTNIFKEDLDEKYGSDLGKKLNSSLRKVLRLSDFALYSEKYKIGEWNKKFQSKIYDDIYRTLEDMMMKVIDYEPDILKKIEEFLAPGCFTGLGEKIVNKILSEIVESKDVDAKTMLSASRLVKREAYSDKTNQLLDQMLLKMSELKKFFDDKFEHMDKSDMTTEEIIQEYMTIYSEYWEWIDIEKVYNWYAEAGKVIPSQAFKIGIFKRIFIADKTKLDKRIDNTKYRKIGNYYQIIENGMSSSLLVDENGKTIPQRCVIFNNFTEDKIEGETIRNLLGLEKLDNEVEKLCKQIEQICLELETVNTTNAELKYGFLVSHGELLEIEMCYKDNEPIKMYYKVQEDGILEKTEIRTRKKIFR